MKVNQCTLIEPFICKEDETVIEVAKKLRSTKLRHIFVVKDSFPVGIISVMDVNNRLVAEGRDASKTKASEIMSKVNPVDAQSELLEVREEMLAKNHVLVPVIKNGRFIGILTLHQAMSGKNE